MRIRARFVVEAPFAASAVLDGRELVVAAKKDYRDVLMWAEYPAEGQASWALRQNLTEEEQRRLKEIRSEDRRQYREWLEE